MDGEPTTPDPLDQPLAERHGAVGRRPLNCGDTKELLCQAAIEIFSQKGIQGARLSDISKKAGLTPAMVHYHFKDKDELVKCTLDRFVKPISNSVWEVAELDLGPLEMLREFHQRLRAIFINVPWYGPFWSRELAVVDGGLKAYMRSIVEPRRLKLFREKIEQGQKQGIINPVLIPELVFPSLLAMIFLPRLSLQSWSELWDKELTEEIASRHIWATIIDGLAAKDGGKLK
jgi:AcrR family transcriptional regulator